MIIRNREPRSDRRLREGRAANEPRRCESGTFQLTSREERVKTTPEVHTRIHAPLSCIITAVVKKAWWWTVKPGHQGSVFSAPADSQAVAAPASKHRPQCASEEDCPADGSTRDHGHLP